VIGPLLTAAASTFAAQGLRKAVEMRRQAIALGAAAVAMAMGLICLTGAAFFVLRQSMSPAEALAILAGVYFLAGGLFILARRRSS
jgi:TRAP-type C4-dicarboxylate transport system permease small subunit